MLTVDDVRKCLGENSARDPRQQLNILVDLLAEPVKSEKAERKVEPVPVGKPTKVTLRRRQSKSDD